VTRELIFTWTGSQITGVSQGTFAENARCPATGTCYPALTPTSTPWNYLYVGTTLSKVCDPRNNNTATGLCTTYGYDTSNRIVSVTKPRGNKDIEIGYYADGTVNWRKDGLGNQTTFAYNPTTRTSTLTDPAGRVTTEVFNQYWQRLSVTEPGDATIPAQTTSFVYDSNGFLGSVTNSVGTTSYLNDYRGNAVRVTDAAGKNSYYDFDSRDLVVSYREARSASSTDNTFRWTYGYDAFGNRVRETNPYLWSRTWTYNTGNLAMPQGVLTAETDWNGNTTTYGYNAFGDVTSITYPGVAGDNVTYTYDAVGRKLSEVGRIAAPGITYTYDVLNAPETSTEPPITNPITGVVHRKKVTYTYDANHLKSKEKVEDVGGSATPDPLRETTYTYDNNDREVAVLDPAGFTTSRVFSNVGTITEVTDAEGRKTATAFNARNLPTSVTAKAYVDPSTGSTTGAQTPSQAVQPGFISPTSSGSRDVIVTPSFIYWTNLNTGTIGRANLDGTGVNQSFITGLDAPSGIATDGTYLYWTYGGLNDTLGTGGVGRALLDGTNKNLTFVTGANKPTGLAVTTTNIYWANFNSQTIGRANIDGTSVNQSFVNASSYPYGVEVRGSFVYWTNYITGTAATGTNIGRANIDGTGINLTFITGANGPTGITSDSNYLYWSNYSNSTIGRAALDGTGANQSYVNSTAVVGGTATPVGIAVDATKLYFTNFDGTKIARTNVAATNTITPADKTLQSMGYDAAGRMVTQVDANGRTRTYSYDPMNRLLTRTLIGFKNQAGVARNIAEETNTWDAIGNKATVRSGNSADGWNYTYDNIGRRTGANSSTQPRYDFYTLDRNSNTLSTGRLTTSSVVVFQKDSTFDARNRPLVVTEQTGTVATNHVVTYTYNAFGLAATMAVTGGGVTTYSYDPIGRTSSVTAPNVANIDAGGATVSGSAVTTTGYDTFGNVTHNRNPRNFTTTTSYDKLNRRTRVDHPVCATSCVTPNLAAFEAWTYDNVGNTKSFRDRRGFTTDYEFDTLNRAVRSTLPQVGTAPRSIRITRYDIVGNPVQSINEIGATVNTTFNELDIERYPSTVTASAKFDYNDLGQLTWSQDPLAAINTFEYLTTGELTKRTDPVNGVWTMNYDPAGRQVKQTDPLGRNTVTAYDLASQPTSTSRYAGTTLVTTESMAYNPTGTLKSRTDARGFTTQYTYDNALRMTAVTLPATPTAITANYGYDLNANMVKYTDGNGGVTSYQYNEWNLRTAVIEPNTATTTTAGANTFSTVYDAGGLPVTETTPSAGTTLNRSFDPLANITAENSTGTGLAAVAKTYATDALGRITGIGPLSFTYNDRNQLIASGGSANNATFTYDLNNRMTTKTQSWSAGYATAFNFGYNARGDLTAITDPISGSRTQTFNAAGQKTGVTQGATTRTVAYDNIGRLQQDSLKNTATAAVLNQVAYTYDNNDNPLTKTITAPGNTSTGTHTYTYDNVNRLASWKNQANAIVAYGYDKNGNRTSAGANTYTYDQRNRILTGPSTTYAWTPRGTPTTQTVGGVTSTFTSDAADRITGAARTGSVVTYQLDDLDRPKGRTINGAIEEYRYSGFETDPIHQIAAADVKFARGPGGELLADATATTVHTVGADGHGDATHWYNAATAAVTETKQYDPFGLVTATTGTGTQLPTTGFQSDWTDPATGDVNMGARWYNPSTGTFRTRDTVFGTLETPFSLNRYTYALNSPLTYMDPRGREAVPAGCDNACQYAHYQATGDLYSDHTSTENADGTPNPGTFITTVPDSNGGETIIVVSAGGIVVNGNTAETTGNISYTPNQGTADAVVALVNQGYPAPAIAVAVNDAAAAAGTKPSTEAIIETAKSNNGAPPTTATDAPGPLYTDDPTSKTTTTTTTTVPPQSADKTVQTVLKGVKDNTGTDLTGYAKDILIVSCGSTTSENPRCHQGIAVKKDTDLYGRDGKLEVTLKAGQVAITSKAATIIVHEALHLANYGAGTTGNASVTGYKTLEKRVSERSGKVTDVKTSKTEEVNHPSLPGDAKAPLIELVVDCRTSELVSGGPLNYIGAWNKTKNGLESQGYEVKESACGQRS
jgi:RHS repeat-associated protein